MNLVFDLGYEILMKRLKVLHVASFKGNIGDNANHTGFRSKLAETLDVDLVYTDFEIREVFWKHKAFDDNFVQLANIHDLVVIGGGNYFELWVENSETGTSFDIKLDLLSQIKSPIIFNALGVDPAQGASEISLTKFRHFCDMAIDSPTMLLSCRNDGSIKTLREVVGDKYAANFYHVPDAGFFTKVLDTYHPELDPNKSNIVIQIAGDMLETRFPNIEPDDISFDEFISSMAIYMERIYKLDVNFILVPHIFRDLGVIDSLINKLPDNIRRGCVSVAPYLVGQKGQDYIFDIYKKSDLVLGMRFHASVCGLGLGKPCIGLVNYRQIDELYNELSLEQFKIHVNKVGFEGKLYSLSESLLNGTIQMPDELMGVWRERLNKFHSDIKVWLKDMGTL